jgi:hypothetical protein
MMRMNNLNLIYSPTSTFNVFIHGLTRLRAETHSGVQARMSTD